MKIVEEGVFQVNRPPADVVNFIKNPENVVLIIPGLSNIRKSGDAYVGDLRVSLGALSGKMFIKFRIDGGGDYVIVRGTATGLQSTADFTLHVATEPAQEGALVKWRFEGAARGLLASLAPSIVQDALVKLAQDAASNLAKHLS
ncbi:MAG: SRPBCC domain-containing protein [Pyrobaculum sp.]